jgi:DNA-binding NarL/FixJ family response regulator
MTILPGTRLSERETQVLRHVAKGMSDREIGKELDVAEETIKTHIGKILRKLGARNRTNAIYLAMRWGIIE